MRCVPALVVVVMLLLSTPVLAGSVVNSAHNLSIPPDYHADDLGDADWTDYNEVCVYCHTPHNATTSVPLWNRQLGEPTSFTPYTSSTLKAVPGSPSESSLLCLSCHDGITALDAVANFESSHAVPQSNRHSNMSDGCTYCHNPTYWNECHGCQPSTDYRGTVIGRNLANDHPVSIAYIANAGIKPKPVDDRFANGVKLIDGKVECPSCHNVHDPAIRPFMRVSNSGSALCYTCHDK